MEFVSTRKPWKPKIRLSLSPFWTVLSSQARFRNSVREMASEEVFVYHSGLAILFWAKHALNSEVIALTLVKWKIGWKKKILLALWRMLGQLQVFLLAANFESDRMTSHKHGLAVETGSKWRPPKSIFQVEFLQDSGQFRGWNVGESKSWMLTSHRRRQKSKLSGVTFSFKYTVAVHLSAQEWSYKLRSDVLLCFSPRLFSTSTKPFLCFSKEY